MNTITDRLIEFIGDTHRPVALLIVAAAFLWAVITKADPLTITTIGATLGGLYWGKSAENIAVTKSDPPKLSGTQ